MSQSPKHGNTESAVEAYTATYTPKALKWLTTEPTETVEISVIEHRVLTGGHHMVYRRDTSFAGNLSEALKLFQW